MAELAREPSLIPPGTPRGPSKLGLMSELNAREGDAAKRVAPRGGVETKPTRWLTPGEYLQRRALRGSRDAFGRRSAGYRDRAESAVGKRCG